MVQAPIWSFEEKLAPDLFTENYLLRNHSNRRIVMKEINSIYTKKLGNYNEDKIVEYMNKPDIRNKYYNRVIRLRKERKEEGFVHRAYVEYTPFKLFDLIAKTPSKRINENIARYYLIQILDVMEQLHSRQVYYLTLRQDDLFLNERFNLRLNDFCLPYAILNCMSTNEWTKHLFKTHSSISPELFTSKDFNENSDVFNLGVIMFSMVTGFRPFRELCNGSDLFFKLILTEQYSSYWNLIEENSKIQLSPEFKDLVFKMLNVNHKKRIGIEEIRNHPWLLSNDVPCYDFVNEYFLRILNNYEKNKEFCKNKGNQKSQLLKNPNLTNLRETNNYRLNNLKISHLNDNITRQNYDTNQEGVIHKLRTIVKTLIMNIIKSYLTSMKKPE
jgi:serine/threonine protein kinase